MTPMQALAERLKRIDASYHPSDPTSRVTLYDVLAEEALGHAPTPADVEAALWAVPYKHHPQCGQIPDVPRDDYCHPEPDYPAMAAQVLALWEEAKG